MYVHDTNVCKSLRLIYMGQCLCTDPHSRTKSRRSRLRHHLPPPFAAGSPPDDSPPRPTRRHNSLSPESARRAAAHGLRLPGEAQPMSVRRCTYRHRHTPTLAVPTGARGTACRPALAESQLQSESQHPPPPPPPPPTPPQTRRQRPPWTRHKPPESCPAPSAEPT